MNCFRRAGLRGGLLALLVVGGTFPAPAQTIRPLRFAYPDVASLVGSYEGAIDGKYAIRMQLSLSYDSTLVGQYYYRAKGQPLQLRGRLFPTTGYVQLRESVAPDTAATGWFTVQVPNHEAVVLGTWYNRSGTTLVPVELRRLAGTAPPATAKARVASKTYFKDFTIPIVSVPDAGVTRLLAQWFSLESLMSETPADLRERLADQKETESRYSTQELRYEVGYNGRGLLSITTLSEGLGASVWYDHRTQTIDLNTGFPVVLADEIRPELVPAFEALGQQKLQKITKEYVPTQDGFLHPEDVAGVLGQQFSLGSTQEYTVSAAGLTFDHPVSYDGLSNFVWKVLTGNFLVEFSHAELAPFLKPDSPLRRLR